MNLLLHFASFLLYFFNSFCFCLNPDGLSLLALKAAIEADPNGVLNSWSETDSTPCRWSGVVCRHRRVTSISLANKGFSGYIPSELGAIDSLKRLSLAQNNFSKPIPSRLFNASNLFNLDLSHNSLSGPIPAQIYDLKNLTLLDLSSNLLNGSLPDSLSELKNLVGTLNLSYNLFSGEIPSSYGHFPVEVSLDLRHNKLTGKIPQVGTLLNQGPTAFYGNPSLCGFPLRTACPEAQSPRVFASTEDPQHPRTLYPISANTVDKKKGGSGFVTLPIILGIPVVVGAVSLSVWLIKNKWRSSEVKMGKEKMENEVEEECEKGKFVVVDEGFSLELEDLLRASAFVVGKGRSGIVYKVVAGRGPGGGGAVVAVRRLSEGYDTLRFKDFETEIEAIRKVQHPNIVRLRAYYYANDEKLLVSDFIGNGSLHAALHGQPSNSLPPLCWAVRLKIAQGTARGLTYIHEYSQRKYVHGNIKSTKILLDEDLHPYISGSGLHRIVPSTSKFTTSASKNHNLTETTGSSAIGSRVSAPSTFDLAPEARISGNKFTQKCDVYSFGIVLLEILTGRLPDTGLKNNDKGLEALVQKVFREGRPLSEIIDPSLLQEVYAKRQVIALFHIALNCTELDPELRPRMKMVSESIDGIKNTMT